MYREGLWLAGYSDEGFDEAVSIAGTEFLQALLVVRQLDRAFDVFERRHCDGVRVLYQCYDVR